MFQIKHAQEPQYDSSGNNLPGLYSGEGDTLSFLFPFPIANTPAVYPAIRGGSPVPSFPRGFFLSFLVGGDVIFFQRRFYQHHGASGRSIFFATRILALRADGFFLISSSAGRIIPPDNSSMGIIA